MYDCYKYEEIQLIHIKDDKLFYDTHNHSSTYTLGIVLEGELYLRKGEGPFKIDAKEGFLIMPYEPHSMKVDVSCEMISISIKKEEIEKSPLSIVNQKVLHLLKETGVEGIEECKDRISDLLREIYLHRPMKVFDTAIRETLTYYNQSQENALRIDEIAQKVNYSKFHLIRKFNQEVGLTPHKFYMQARVRKAQTLLETQHNIAKVAFLTGFCDESHLIRVFKHIVGITPSEYIHAIKQIER